MKTFFGCTFIEKEKLEEAKINHPIKYEYYKEINEDYTNSENKAKFGIQIVKTEYISNKPKIETKSIKYITNDEAEEDRILKIFKENQVSLANSEEIISELLRKNF